MPVTARDTSMAALYVKRVARVSRSGAGRVRNVRKRITVRESGEVGLSWRGSGAIRLRSGRVLPWSCPHISEHLWSSSTPPGEKAEKVVLTDRMGSCWRIDVRLTSFDQTDLSAHQYLPRFPQSMPEIVPEMQCGPLAALLRRPDTQASLRRKPCPQALVVVSPLASPSREGNSACNRDKRPGTVPRSPA